MPLIRRSSAVVLHSPGQAVADGMQPTRKQLATTRDRLIKKGALIGDGQVAAEDLRVAYPPDRLPREAGQAAPPGHVVTAGDPEELAAGGKGLGVPPVLRRRPRRLADRFDDVLQQGNRGRTVGQRMVQLGHDGDPPTGQPFDYHHLPEGPVPAERSRCDLGDDRAELAWPARKGKQAPEQVPGEVEARSGPTTAA